MSNLSFPASTPPPSSPPLTPPFSFPLSAVSPSISSSRSSSMSLKTAIVCGAHTELGKFVTRELLRSPIIFQIYALCSVDPRADIHIRPHEYQKLRLIVESLDYVENSLKKIVDKVDIAFCCLGSSKNDLSKLGPYDFRKLNYDIPRRFVEEMFSRNVVRIGILSHTGADTRAHSEFLKVKGELVNFVRRRQKELGRYASGVLLMRVPLLLTNLKDTNGENGNNISMVDEIKQKAALKFDMGPAKAVHVRDVAKAMVEGVLGRLEMHLEIAEESDLRWRFRRVQVELEEMFGEEIVTVAEEVRERQRRGSATESSPGTRETHHIRDNSMQRESFARSQDHYLRGDSLSGLEEQFGAEAQVASTGHSVEMRHGVEYNFYDRKDYLGEHEEDVPLPGTNVARIAYVNALREHGGNWRNVETMEDAVESQYVDGNMAGEHVEESAVASVQALARQLGRGLDVGGMGVERVKRARSERGGNSGGGREDVRRGVLEVGRGRNGPGRLGPFVNSTDSLSSATGVGWEGQRRRVYQMGEALDEDDSAGMGGGEYVSMREGEYEGMRDGRGSGESRKRGSGSLRERRADGESGEFLNMRRGSLREGSGGGGNGEIWNMRRGSLSFGNRGRMRGSDGGVERLSGVGRLSGLVGRAIKATDRKERRRGLGRMEGRAGGSAEVERVRVRGGGDIRAIGETAI